MSNHHDLSASDSIGEVPVPRKNPESRRGRPFQKGQGGRPRGSRNKATLMAEALIEGEMEEVVQKAIKRAKAGFPDGLKLVLDRLVPPRRERPLEIELPEITTAADAERASAAILARVAAGELTPREGKMLATLLESRANLIQARDVENRLASLENAMQYLRVQVSDLQAKEPAERAA